MNGKTICSLWQGLSPGSTLIELAAASKRFGGKTIIPPSDLVIRTGDFVAVSGPNGGGKTTFLRLLLRLIKPSGGEVVYYDDGDRVSSIPIGYLPQKSSLDTHFPITVGEVVRSGLIAPPSLRRRDAAVREADDEAMAAVMEFFGLEGLGGNVLADLSGGQVQRALIARALVSRPSLIVMDEPLSYLDDEYGRRLCEMLASLRGRATVIVVSHQMAAIGEIATRRIVIDHKLTEL